MELRLVDSDSRWESLLDVQPEATLFHMSAWLRFQERSFGYRLVRLVARHEGTDVGLFPLFVTRQGPFRVAASPRGVAFRPTLVAPRPRLRVRDARAVVRAMRIHSPRM